MVLSNLKMMDKYIRLYQNANCNKQYSDIYERQKNFNRSQGQEQEIKDHFYKEAENYAYWYFKDEDKME